MLLLPSLVADELSRGLTGRVATLNRLGALQSEVNYRLRRAAGTSADYPIFGTLAKLYGVPEAEFIRDHTLLPWLRAIAWFASASGSRVTTRSAPHGPSGAARYCPMCEKDDRNSLDSQGVGIWRREPNFVGHEFCQKHRCAYYSVTAGSDGLVFVYPPSHYAGICREVPCTFDPFIDRYRAISKALATTPAPTALAQVRRCLSVQLGFSLSCITVRTSSFRDERLVECIRDQAPSGWLSRNFSRLYAGPDGRAGEGYGRLTEVVALALTAAFSTPESAMASLLRTPDDSLWLGFSKYDFLECYGELRGSTAKIARRFGVRQEAIRLRLRSVGLPALGQHTHEDTAALQAISQGVSVSAACQAHGGDQVRVAATVAAGSELFWKLLQRMSSTRPCVTRLRLRTKRRAYYRRVTRKRNSIRVSARVSD